MSKNRDQESLGLSATIAENIASTGYRINEQFKGIISFKKEAKYVDEQIESLSIKCAGKNYKVNTGRIEFIPANERGENIALSLEFNSKDNQKFKKLFTTIYHHIKELSFPDTDGFKSTKAFVEYLISE